MVANIVNDALGGIIDNRVGDIVSWAHHMVDIVKDNVDRTRDSLVDIVNNDDGIEDSSVDIPQQDANSSSSDDWVDIDINDDDISNVSGDIVKVDKAVNIVNVGQVDIVNYVNALEDKKQADDVVGNNYNDQATAGDGIADDVFNNIHANNDIDTVNDARIDAADNDERSRSVRTVDSVSSSGVDDVFDDIADNVMDIVSQDEVDVSDEEVDIANYEGLENIADIFNDIMTILSEDNEELYNEVRW